MILRLTTVHENARSALECGSSSYRLRFMRHVCKAVAAATALQGAFGTCIFMAAKDLRSSVRMTANGLGITTGSRDKRGEAMNSVATAKRRKRVRPEVQDKGRDFAWRRWMVLHLGILVVAQALLAVAYAGQASTMAQAGMPGLRPDNSKVLPPLLQG